LDARIEAVRNTVVSLEQNMLQDKENRIPPTYINLEGEIQKYVEPMKTAIFYSEKTCSRLVDDALSAVEKNQQKVLDLREEVQQSLLAIRKDLILLETRNTGDVGTYAQDLIDKNSHVSPKLIEDIERDINTRLNNKIKKIEEIDQTTASQLSIRLQKMEELEQQLNVQCQTRFDKFEELEQKLTAEFGRQIAKVSLFVKKLSTAKKRISSPDDRKKNADEKKDDGLINIPQQEKDIRVVYEQVYEPETVPLAPLVRRTTSRSIKRKRARSPRTQSDPEEYEMYSQSTDSIFRRKRKVVKSPMAPTAFARGTRSLSTRIRSLADRARVRHRGRECEACDSREVSPNRIRSGSGTRSPYQIKRPHTTSVAHRRRDSYSFDSSEISRKPRRLKKSVPRNIPPHTSAYTRNAQNQAQRRVTAAQRGRTQNVRLRPINSKPFQSKYSAEQARLEKAESFRRRRAIDGLYDELRLLEGMEFGGPGARNRRM